MSSTPSFQISFDSPDSNPPLRGIPSTVFKGRTLEEISLGDVRAVSKVSRVLSFTHDGKTSLTDDLSLAYYLSLTSSKPEKPKAKADKSVPASEDVADAPDQNASDPKKAALVLAPVEAVAESNGDEPAHAGKTSGPFNVSPIPTILLQLISSTGKTSTSKNYELNDKLNKEIGKLIELGKPVEAAKLQSIASSLAPSTILSGAGFAANPSSASVTEAADLTESQWQNIFLNNRILNGYTYNLTNKKEFLVKAPKRAFDLRSRDSPKELSAQAPMAAVTKPATKEYFQPVSGIPPYYIYDDATVTVTEVQSAFQGAMAREGFDSSAIQASAGFPTGSFGAVDLSVARSDQHSYQNQELEARKTSMLRVAYNFPRVVIEFRPEDFQLSKECAADIQAIKRASASEQQAKREQFFSDYGLVFTMKVTLGGYLYSDREVNEQERGKLNAKKEETKLAAGASFQSPKGSAGGSSSFGFGTQSNDSNSSISRTGRLTWEARGGDTVLCSNPPAWAATVKDYRYWRLMEQSLTLNMLDLMRAIDPSAVYNLEYRKSTDNDDSSAQDQSAKDRIEILRSISQIVRGSTSSVPFVKLREFYENNSAATLQDYNDWVIKEGKAPRQINVGRKWGDVNNEQRIYYGLFLQATRKLNLVN